MRAQGVKVKESTVFSRKYCTELTSLSTLAVFEVEIWCFRGGDVIPKWIERNSGACSHRAGGAGRPAAGLTRARPQTCSGRCASCARTCRR
jgi:hypothetical protein